MKSLSIGAALVISSSLLLGACGHDPDVVYVQVPPTATTAKKVEQPERAPSQRVSPSEVTAAIENMPQPDRDFLLQAAGANIAAIRLGQLAAQRGHGMGVRSLGREMVDTHIAMSDQLRQSAELQGVTLPMAKMTPDQHRAYERLSKLSGAEFDETYLRDVKRIQDETIHSFQKEATDGKLSELAMFANQSLPLLNQRVRTVRNQIRSM